MTPQSIALLGAILYIVTACAASAWSHRGER